jgi:opacity protein-like surface antigen
MGGDGPAAGRRAAMLMLAVLCGVGAATAHAEDSDQLRWYIGGRYDLLSLTHTHDFVGGEIGVNFTRYLGLELALDNWERKAGDLSEIAVTSITPQLRLRYPLLDDRLTPYLIAGWGVAVSQANDGRMPVEWVDGKTETHIAGTVGAGLEYFIADNIAVGWEVKELLSDYVAYEADGRQGRTSLSSPLMGISLRVFYPLLHPEAAAAAAAAATARLYVGLRTGGALLLDREPFPGVSARPEQSVFGSNFTFGFGVSLGADFGRYLAVELSLDNYEVKLGLPGVGDIGEYAVFPVMVQPRLRYPLLDDRLEPSVFCGIGAELGQINDLNETGKALNPNAEDVTIIGGVGAGTEYLVMEDVAIGLQAKYIVSRGHQFSLPGTPAVSGDFDSLLLFGTLRVVFADL